MNEKRRVLVCVGHAGTSFVWLDHADSCAHHKGDRVVWHIYRDKGGRHAVRCPNGLSQEEWGRVVIDDPPGSYREKAALLLQPKVRKSKSYSIEEG